MTPDETRFMLALASNLHDLAVMTDNRRSNAVRERMDNPKPGDLVIDIYAATLGSGSGGFSR